MHPNPTDADLASNIYRGEAGREYHEGKRALRPEALKCVTALRAEKFQCHIRPEDVVFEFGVGAGWNLASLHCGRRIGSDAAEFLADRVRALGIEFVSSPAEVAPGIANVAICHHTLEHLLEPAAALRELARILKPEGVLILHVPWERERRYAQHQPDEPNHHLHSWNAQTLGNLVQLCGFCLERVVTRRYGYDRFAANLATRLRLGGSGFRVLRGILIALRPLREVELIARRQ